MSTQTKCDCGGSFTIGIEYAYDDPEHYDGISEWWCRNCNQRVGRWSGIILSDGEYEPRFGVIRQR